MIDKNLLRLLGSNKKYIFYAVGLMVLGLFANVGITASICWAVDLAIHYDEYSGGAIIFLWPAVCADRNCDQIYHLSPCGRSEGLARQKGKEGSAREGL